MKGRRSRIHPFQFKHIAGERRVLTDSLVTVEEIFGQDPYPDSWFEVVKAGSTGNTWRIQIAGVTDPQGTERSIPAVDYTYTVTSDIAEKEWDVAQAIIAGLNADTNFRDAYLRAQRVKDIPVVHITSRVRSMGGDYYERPNSGDFAVTTSGTAEVLLGWDNLISRGKSTSLARDPDSPHRLGILGISGSVQVTPQEFAEQRIYKATKDDTGSYDLRVNASLVSPQDFYIRAPSNIEDFFIKFMRIGGGVSGLKFNQFLSISTLTNGILIDIKSDDKVNSLPIIKNTEDIKHDFTWPRGFELHVAPSVDDFMGTFELENPFVLRALGSYTIDDYIRVRIRDDLTSTSLKSLEFVSFGFLKEI